MAPRRPETREHFIERLRYAATRNPVPPVRFGGAHYSHVAMMVDGRWQVRGLVVAWARAEAFLRERGRFMPEDAEEIAEPGTRVLLDAADVEALVRELEAGPWPLPPVQD